MCRPAATMPTNWSYMSITRPCSTSLPSGVSGVVKLGWSFSGPETMVVAVMPSVFSRPETSPVSSSTPIEPVSVPFAGEDARRRHRDHVAGRGRRAAHHRDHRLLRGDVGDRVVQGLAAGDAAAGLSIATISAFTLSSSASLYTASSSLRSSVMMPLTVRRATCARPTGKYAPRQPTSTAARPPRARRSCARTPGGA